MAKEWVKSPPLPALPCLALDLVVLGLIFLDLARHILGLTCVHRNGTLARRFLLCGRKAFWSIRWLYCVYLSGPEVMPSA